MKNNHMRRILLVSLVIATSSFFMGCNSDTAEEGPDNVEISNTPNCETGFTGEPIRCEPGFLLEGVEFFERYVTADGIDWHVVEAGDLDAPTILFIHGVPESWYDWHQQMIDLSSDYHVIAFDLKGYGRSDHPNADASVGSGFYSASQVATEITPLMNALGLNEPVTLVSHDWGTLVSSYLVFQDPTRFNAWARMSAPLGGDGEKILELNTQFEQFQDFNFCRTVFSQPQFIFNLYGYDGELGLNSSQSIPNAIVDRVNEEWRFNGLTPNTACKYYSDTPEIMDPFFWSDTLVDMMAMINFPVYLIQAEDDDRQPLHLFDGSVADLPEDVATLYPISESGHFMMSEQPDKITQAIRELIHEIALF
jgi:pimeloyl-ACP methyl ester carboxylesterase